MEPEPPEASREEIMHMYEIISKSGQSYGTYHAETPEAAFRAMVADGGGEYGSEEVGTEADWIIRKVTGAAPDEQPLP